MITLPLPEEPAELKAKTRSLLERSPEEGAKVIAEAGFVADALWEEWHEELECAGMDYARFLEVARSYAVELRLWVVGERIWEHCVSGLAGRVRRRLPAPGSETESSKVLISSEVCG